MLSKRAVIAGAGAAALAFCVLAGNLGRATAPAGGVPVGTVTAFSGERIPDGWLLCDGRSLRRQDWPELFRAIGTSHGEGVSPLGVREADFNLPDYRGRFLRGLDLSQDGGRLNSDPGADIRSAARAGTGNTGNRVGSYQPDGTALPRDPLEPFRTVVSVPAVSRPRVGEQGTPAAVETVFVESQETRRKYLITGGDPETRPKNVSVRWIIRAKP